MTDGHLPWITLVTPSYNQARYLRTTIESVLAQGYPRLNYLIMDGGSTDGSVDIIREYSSRLTHWETGPDAGQSDAIRKGFERGGGEIINWLNSDDYLEPGALRRVADLAAREPDAALLAFPVRDFHDADHGQQTVRVSIPGHLAVDNLLLRRRPRPRRHQPGVFIRRDDYERVGGLRTDMHYCMDFDLYLRIVATGRGVAYGDGVVASFRHHEAAKTRSGTHFVRCVLEYAEAAERVGLELGRAPVHAPHAPLLVAACLAALRNRSTRDLGTALSAMRRIGLPSVIGGASVFAVRRYVLGRRDELP
jgi:glycosyltransferase involved in cell wall biosynthesis